MSHGTVYLSGPIAGLTFHEAMAWRVRAKVALKWHGIEALSPLRDNEKLVKEGVMTGDAPGGHPLVTARGITARDRSDVRRSDLILVNLLGAKRVSIGTVMELAWADFDRIPVVALIEPGGNVHDHCMVDQVIDFRTDDFDQAIEICVSVLCP